MFTKKTGREPRPVASVRNPAETSFSVLGADTLIKGDLSATADLHVDGRVEGDIDCGSIVQGESSEIVGGISAESARLAGTIRGSITTRELVILKTARIHGDVQYDTLTIEQGAVIEGRLSPRGSAPAREPQPRASEELLIVTQTAE